MEIDIKRLFEDFLNLKDIWNGKTAKEIVEERYEAYDSLRDMFVNIDSLTKEDFESFAKNNKSWNKLERQKKWYLADMEKLKESLKYLSMNRLIFKIDLITWFTYMVNIMSEE